MNLFPRGRSEDDPDDGDGREAHAGRDGQPVPPPPRPAPALYPSPGDGDGEDETPYAPTGRGGEYGAPGRHGAYGPPDRSGGGYGTPEQGDGGYGPPGQGGSHGTPDQGGGYGPPGQGGGSYDRAGRGPAYTTPYPQQDPAGSYGRQPPGGGPYGGQETPGTYDSYGTYGLPDRAPGAGQAPDAPAPSAVYDWQQDQVWPPVPPVRSAEPGQGHRQPQPQPQSQAQGQGQGQAPGPGGGPGAAQNPGTGQGGRAPGRGRGPAPVAGQSARHGGPGRVADKWGPISVDGALPDFLPRPPTGGLSYRPDTICDGWSTHALDLRLASVRGYAHRAEGRPREDDAAAAWDERSGTVVFAVADGVSDARQPHIGSQLACRSAVDELLAQVRASSGVVTDWPKLLGTVHWQLLTQARRLLKQPDAGVEETADLLATTLIAGAATPTPDGVRVTLVSVGDSGAWAIKYGELYPLTGGKSVGADGLVSSAVRPMPYVPADVVSFAYRLDPDSVLLLGTDGFGDPVGDGRNAVGKLFGSELRQPVPPLAFAQLLDFYRETFDDDRTLVALWPRGGGPGGPR